MTQTVDDLIYAAGIPFGALADKAGIDAKTLLSIRRGRWNNPRVATVAKLAKALRVTPTKLRAAIAASRDARG